MRALIAVSFSVFLLSTTASVLAQAPARPASSSRTPALGTTAAHPLAKPIAIGTRSVEAAGSLQDYTATLYRRMWLGRKFSESTVRLKHRVDPFSVYLLFQQPHAGREVLFINGWNNNNIYAHEGSGALSFLGSMSLDPNGAQAMEGSRYPITNIGVSTMAKMIVKQWQDQMQFQQPSDVDVKLYPEAQLGNEPCKVVETTFAKSHPEHQTYRIRLFITRDTNIPFAVQVFGFPQQQGAEPPKLEDVRYQNLKTNVGLTNQDFDFNNPAYKF